MFKKITRKVTTDAVETAKEIIKKDTNCTVEKIIPVIITGITIGSALISIFKGRGLKPMVTTTRIVNNYYNCNFGGKA